MLPRIGVRARLLLAAIAVAAFALLSLPGAAQADPVPGHIQGTVSAADSEAAGLNGVTVSVQTVGGGATVASGTTEAVAGTDGFYSVPVAAGSYWLRFEAAGYVSTYLLDEDDEPATVTVDGAGTVTAAGVDQDDDRWLADVTLLRPAPTPKQEPRLTGDAKVGQTLTVSAGSWSGISVDTDFVTVEWFLDGTSADEYGDGEWSQKFEVPLAAVGSKVKVRLTVDDPDGVRAAAVYETSSSVVPKPSSSTAATLKKNKLTVVVSVPGVPNPTGTITVLDGKKAVGRATLRERSKGKAVVRIAKLKPGKHKLVVSYAGPAQIVGSKTVVKVKIPT